MLHAKVDNTGIETQRSVVKEEKRQRVDNQPYASFSSEMFKRMFVEHPYNWVPIGSMEHLDAAEESDYVNFYRTFYVPENATLSIAGDINIEQAKKWISQYFGTIPSGQAINLYRDFENLDDSAFEKSYGISKSKFNSSDFLNSADPDAKKIIAKYTSIAVSIPRPEKDVSQLPGIITDTIYDNIQSPALFMGFKFPDQNHPDSYALDLMNEVLSGGSSSRINKTLVEKMELAIYAFSYNYGLEDAGTGIFAAIAGQDIELATIQGAFDEQIEKIKNELISDEEFQKIRNQYENSLVSSNSSAAGIAENLADNYVYFGNTNRVNTLLDNYLKVTKEDIQRVAQKYLTTDKRVILYYLPKQ
jgi:predicted Zn-dependent peptidase